MPERDDAVTADGGVGEWPQLGAPEGTSMADEEAPDATPPPRYSSQGARAVEAYTATHLASRQVHRPGTHFLALATPIQGRQLDRPWSPDRRGSTHTVSPASYHCQQLQSKGSPQRGLLREGTTGVGMVLDRVRNRPHNCWIARPVRNCATVVRGFA